MIKIMFSSWIIVFCLSFITISLIANLFLSINYNNLVKLNTNSEKASYLALETIEIIKNIKDKDFNNLSEMEGSGLKFSNNQWVFDKNPDVSGIFTREIYLVNVNPNKKKMMVVIRWDDEFSKNNVYSLSTYFTNWKGSSDLIENNINNKILTIH